TVVGRGGIWCAGCATWGLDSWSRPSSWRWRCSRRLVLLRGALAVAVDGIEQRSDERRLRSRLELSLLAAALTPQFRLFDLASLRPGHAAADGSPQVAVLAWHRRFS